MPSSPPTFESFKEENARLREQLNEVTSLMMKGEALRERVMLDAIMAGAYDRKG